MHKLILKPIGRWNFELFKIQQDRLLSFLKSTLECGPMPNVMAALPNIGGALCSTPHSLADAHYYSAVQ